MLHLSKLATKEVDDVCTQANFKRFQRILAERTKNRNLLCINIPNYIILLRVFSYPSFQYTQINGRGEVETAAFIWSRIRFFLS